MTSLYIHIPFCKKKCNYCDFVSYAGKEDLIDEYVEALIKEIQSSPRYRSGLPPSPSKMERGVTNEVSDGVRSIYFGGGTPTLLEPKHFEKILSSVFCAPCSEISLEANPGTADKARLKALRQLGINRISIGAQSFADQHLKTLGRIHDSETIYKFYGDARAAGFENINLDLIFALPGQSLEQWKEDLWAAISLNPNHLSIYNLQIEAGTPFHDNPQIKPLSDDLELAMYEFTIETLWLSGYKHYEISNFAQPDRECQHNINYWKNGNYLGIGAGAHSHVNGTRWANPDSVEKYIGCGCAARNDIRWTSDDSSRATDQRETLFMGLRLLEGLPHQKFNGFEKELVELVEAGLLTRENSHVKLTRKGLYLANEVFEKFI